MKTALVIDIDGVVAPVKPRGACRVYTNRLGTITVPEVNSEFLRGLDCDKYWLTYQSGFIPQSLKNSTRIFGEIPLEDYQDKYDVISAWAQLSHYDKVVWVDDECEDDYADELVRYVSEGTVKFSVISPEMNVGLTPNDRARIVTELDLRPNKITFKQYKKGA